MGICAPRHVLFWLKIINGYWLRACWKNINKVVLVIAKKITKISFGGLESPGGDCMLVVGKKVVPREYEKI